ncbi:hypothetical protein P3G55_17610 [Leptospira sp. 96542]|nr:hypothetical protein [Leptospira sp. 96542]
MENYEKIVIKEILSELNFSKIVNVYSLHQKYRIGPGHLIKAINFLLNKGIIEINGDTLKLLPIRNDTELLSLLDYFYLDKPEFNMKEIAFDIPLITNSEFYLPNAKLFFKNFD